MFGVQLDSKIPKNKESVLGLVLMFKPWNEISVSKDKIGYLATINAPATQISTVNESLNQALKIIEKLDLPSLTVVFDQAMYSKAVKIIWKNYERFHSIVVRLGAFHTILTMLAIISKHFHDAELHFQNTKVYV